MTIIASFAEKNEMKKALLFMIFLLCACEVVDIGGEPSAEKEDDGVLYAAAIAFPEGYDWRKDSLGGRVDANVLLFRDGEKILNAALPGHSPSNIGPIAIAGGHVYSGHFDRDGNILCRDGKEMLRLEKGWQLQDICVTDSLYTLETKADTEQWLLRRNGRETAAGTGRIMGTLYEDCGSVCFAYTDKEDCFFAENGIPEQISPIKGMSSILYVRRVGGVMHVLGKTGTSGKLFAKIGDAAIKAAHPGSYGSIRDVSVLNVEGEAVVHFQIPGTKEPEEDGSAQGLSCWNEIFFKNGELLERTSGTEQAVAVCDNCPELCCACSPYGASGPVAIQYGGERFHADGDYRIYSYSALCCSRDGFFAGANDAAEDFRPVILTVSETLKYDFNGYFICLDLP